MNENKLNERMKMNENKLNESFVRFEKAGFFRRTKQVLNENWDEEEITKMKELVASGDIDNIGMVEQMLSPAIFEQLIEVEYGELLRFLKIDGHGVEAVGKLLNTKTIWLGNDYGEIPIPKDLYKLPNLIDFGLFDTKYVHVPEFICNLINLKSLYVVGNIRIKYLPENIGNLVNLKFCNFSSNILVSLPETLGYLSKLEILNLDRNKLTEFPDSISNLVNLKKITIFDNRLPKDEIERIKILFPFVRT